MSVYSIVVIFFFQAEDGIRDGRVTGVQTCALPISSACPWSSHFWVRALCVGHAQARKAIDSSPRRQPTAPAVGLYIVPRSEERRVGKECRSRGPPNH